MKFWIVALHRANVIANGNANRQLFKYLTVQSLTGCLSGFDFASGELPSIFHVAISTLCGKHTTGSIANHASHHLNVFS